MENDKKIFNGDKEILEVQNSLRQLESNEWRRWGITIFLTLLLTGGVVILARMPNAPINAFVNTGAGLFALVVVFDFYILYHCFTVSRLRRKITLQIAAIATLEALKAGDGDANSECVERRRDERFETDSLVKVEFMQNGQKKLIHGRLRDFSESGVGAVIPDSIQEGDVVQLVFTTPDFKNVSEKATVRHRRGFRYGFEFVAHEGDADAGKDADKNAHADADMANNKDVQ